MPFMSLDELAESAPVVRIKWSNGTAEDITFPLLTMADYAPWLAEETKARRDRAAKAIPANLPPGERARALQAAASDVATFADLSPLIQAEGAERVVRISMTNAGIPSDKQDRILKIMGAGRVKYLGTHISTLFGSINSETVDAPPPAAGNAGAGGAANPSPADAGSGGQPSQAAPAADAPTTPPNA